MKFKIILFTVIFFSTQTLCQEKTMELYKKSIELIHKDCKCDAILILTEEFLKVDKLQSKKGQLEIADSTFFAKIKHIDTTFHVFKLLPLSLIGDYIEVVASNFLMTQRKGESSLLFINSTHFFFSFNCNSKKYFFVKKATTSL